MNDSLFSPRIFAALVALGFVSFIGLAIISLFATDLERAADHGASSYSVSAIGHQGLVEALRASGESVVVSRDRSGEKLGDFAVLLALEPRHPEHLEELVGKIRGRMAMLTALPKWHVTRNSDNERWIDVPEPMPASVISEIITPLIADLGITRGHTSRQTHSHMVSGLWIRDVPEPYVNDIQLMRHHRFLKPLITVGSGVLLAKVDDRFGQHFLLSDPDILNNQGLLLGRNAELTALLLNAISQGSGTYVYDETIHGFGEETDLWRSIFSPPLIASTLAVIAALLALVLAGLRRFGPALKPVPAHARGRATLYEVTAMLLDERGDFRLLAREYAEMTIRRLSLDLHVTLRSDRRSAVGQIAAIGRRRNIPGNLEEILNRLGYLDGDGPDNRRDAVATAAELEQWSREIMHGTR